MPYIKKEQRNTDTPSNVGELNYMVHQYISEYLDQDGHSYQSYNNVVGVIQTILLKTTTVGMCDNPVGKLRLKIQDILACYKGRAKLSEPDTFDQVAIDINGALVCIQMEFYSRMVRPYEDTKIEQNGDCKPYIGNAKEQHKVRANQPSYQRTNRPLNSLQNDKHAQGMLAPYTG